MVTLADTSAWVAHFRGLDTPVDRRLEALLSSGDEIAITDVIVMELLAGARDAQEEATLRDAMAGLEFLPVLALDWEDAAAIYRTCRRAGATIRNLTDCLIATVAIRHDAAVLADDRDFEIIARHAPLHLA
jgi:predicted nucleic acid-binding protein